MSYAIEFLNVTDDGTVGHDSTPPASALHLESARNNVGVPSEGAEPYGEILAPAVIIAPSGCLASIKTPPMARENSGLPTATCNGHPDAPNHFPVKQILRDQRRRDLIAAVEEWRRASGPDRAWWRQDALHRLQEWRRLYRIPERAAFQAAVAAAQQRRHAA